MISIVVPAYNAAHTLAACLEALQSQTRSPDEIFVVDDGSKDQTAQVAGVYGVRLLSQTHQGPATARNLGISNAHGEIIMFTDADCEPTPTWIAEMLLPFSDPSVAGVKGSYDSHQHEGVARLVQIEFEERYDRLERFPTIDFIDTYSAAFRTAVLREKGGFEPAFPQAVSEDAELSYRLARAGCRLIFNRRAVVYHQHPSTWRSYLRRKIKFGFWRIMAYRLHPGKALRDSYTPQILKMQIAMAFIEIGLLGFSLSYHFLIWGALAVLIGLVITAIPFFRRVIKQDQELLIPAFAYIIARAFASAIGVAGGLVGMFFFRSVLNHKD
jgi:cellulose synthase/poly-beta-1,6-N-acetylglucosamine synthase-like glycosyltransferase